jgi:hypothetical protein
VLLGILLLPLALLADRFYRLRQQGSVLARRAPEWLGPQALQALQQRASELQPAQQRRRRPCL